MKLLRNLAFYLVFYLGSIVVTSAALLAIPFGREVFRRRVSDWSGLQRWCVVNLLGVDLRGGEAIIAGAFPMGQPVGLSAFFDVRLFIFRKLRPQRLVSFELERLPLHRVPG